MERVGESCRETYLPVLKEIHSSCAITNWRFRHLLASQLSLLSKLFTPAATFSIVAPLALELLRDEVASVRSNTFSVAAVIIERLALSPGETWHDEFVSSITEFSTGKDYMERQVYVNVCATLVRGKVSGLLGGNVLRVLRVLLQENGGDDFFESKLVPPLL